MGDVSDGGGANGGADGTDATGGAGEPQALPLDGDVLMYTGATASVAPERLAPLLREVQSHLDPQFEAYARSYERAHADEERAVFLVPDGHWTDVGSELGLPEREVDAVRRAHAQQLRRIGTRTDRREELETALEIREAVVVGRRSSVCD
ncbi:hypothetical protein [Halobellus limi]|uniref:DUF8048 domain-containing protein n=2 Tax=Halobellus limi TaxID=699433 RepID=A0A1H5W239_9EURY|nr:hypothetical protein [Halobellus limi]SEF93555.1 hypothetical protein SAMN04488133_1146 [Halobellus limi]